MPYLKTGTEYVFTNEYISRLDEGQSSTYEPTVGNEGGYFTLIISINL